MENEYHTFEHASTRTFSGSPSSRAYLKTDSSSLPEVINEFEVRPCTLFMSTFAFFPKEIGKPILVEDVFNE